MEKGKTVGRVFHCIIASAIMLTSGCATVVDVPPLRMKSSTELAVETLRSEWLNECVGVQGGMPDNSTGALLADYVALATAFAVCKEWHNGLVQYLRPIVQKERGVSPANPKRTRSE